jgi:hypothetical protein
MNEIISRGSNRKGGTNPHSLAVALRRSFNIVYNYISRGCETLVLQLICVDISTGQARGRPVKADYKFEGMNWINSLDLSSCIIASYLYILLIHSTLELECI